MGQYSGDELEAAIAEHERFGEMFLQTYAEVKLTRFLMQFKEVLSIDAHVISLKGYIICNVSKQYLIRVRCHAFLFAHSDVKVHNYKYLQVDCFSFYNGLDLTWWIRSEEKQSQRIRSS